MSAALIDTLRERFDEAVGPSHAHAGDDTVEIPADALVDVCTFLKGDSATRMEMLVDVTAVDWLGRRTPRFEVVYHLHSLSLKHRLRLKVPVDGPNPVVPSLCGVWRGANWPERETWDMYGIRFDGHPDLRRVLLYEEFEGHPLRKDYAKRAYQPLVDMPTLPVDETDPEE